MDSSESIAIPAIVSDHEVEIDLVEYRGDNSMFQAMKLDNSVNRNKVKVGNELIDQSMHWFDDEVFEQYPTWEECEQAGIFSRLDLVVMHVLAQRGLLR